MNAPIDDARAYQLFSEALTLPPAGRAAFIDERCRGDAALAEEVRGLLHTAQLAPSTGSLIAGVSAEAPQDDRPLSIGREYGHFRLLDLIGAGGMGYVYRAERTDGVPQTVAIKLLRGAITDESRTQFITEAKLLARLEHPAIARLIDVGVQDGEGWIALEFVRGRPIDEYCDAMKLGLRERVKLLATITDAVASAHRMLVVHRDLKPTNVLVNEQGRPKLIDFGISTALGGPLGSRDPTVDARHLFTPNYAAPEQVTAQPTTVATDIFGLGALAYRLLSGHALFEAQRNPVSYLVAITQQRPAAPSLVAADGQHPADWVRLLRGDLDAIILKAIARDPAERYASAEALLGDLHGYLDGLPVLAGPTGPAYRFGKWARRTRWAWPVSALAVLIIAGLALWGVGASHRAAPLSGSTVYDDDVTAHALYVDAQFVLAARTRETLSTAKRDFEQLTRLYPRRAAGWSGLAATYLLMREFGDMPEGDAYPRAERAADAALALDPQDADAWLSRGFVQFWWHSQPATAFTAFETGIRLAPASARAYQWYANALVAHGDSERALAMIERARALDPGNRAIVADECNALFTAGQRARAVTKLEFMRKIDPDFVAWHRYLALEYLVLGRDAEFVQESVTSSMLQGRTEDAARWRTVGERLATGGHRAMLEQMSAFALEKWRVGGGNALDLVDLRALIGDRDGTLQWLQTALAQRVPYLLSLHSDMALNGYRNDPDIRRLLATIP